MPFEFKKTKLNEGFQLKEQLSGGKMLVSGIIQRANTKNQNGRIYPKSVLAPKVEQYIEHYVKNRNAEQKHNAFQYHGHRADAECYA